MDWTEWTAEQETVRIRVDDGFEEHGFDMAYREVGSGEPVTLFLHGLPTWSYLWRDIHDAADHALMPDLPGFGFTEHASDQAGYSRSIRFLEASVVAFLEEFDLDSVQIVSHDWGGAAALRLAIHFPDLVDRLVVSSAVCYDNFPLDNIHRLGLPRSAAEDKHLWNAVDWEELDEELTYIFEGTYGETDEAFMEAMKAPYLEHPSDDVLRLHKNAASANTNSTIEISDRHDQIECETLLIWPTEDLIVPPEWAERLADDIPNVVDTVLLDESYHWVPEDRPDAFRGAVAEFLD